MSDFRVLLFGVKLTRVDAGMFQFWHIMGKCTVVAKKELMYAGPFGPAAWLCDLVFIPRMQSDVAKQVMHEAAKKARRDKVMLLLPFPPPICLFCFITNAMICFVWHLF